ncbi:MAG: hypothetical protein HQL54_04760 [Magnetococcales bacterium]|nr:hypothetical protein [Magnetococcales bacterium]
MGKKSTEEKILKQAMKIAKNPTGKSSKKQAKPSQKQTKKSKSIFKKMWDEVEDIFD